MVSNTRINPVTVAGIWLRVSSDKQDERNQLARIEEWIRAHGYIQGKIYQAHDKSATKREHYTLLREAIADMKSGLIDILVVRNTDRIDRTEDLGMIVKEVKEVGGRIESVDEPWLGELSGLGEKLMTGVTEYMNAEYVRKLAASIGDAKASRRAVQSFCHGNAPYGYTIVGYHADGTRHERPGKCLPCYPERGGRKTLEPNDMKSVIVRIFEEVAAGKSFQAVAEGLHADGIPTQKGGAWRFTVVGQAIHNITYRGHVQYNGATYMTVEPIVSNLLWKAANDAAGKRAASSAGRGGGRPGASLLRPKCGRCGGPMFAMDRDRDFANYYCPAPVLDTGGRLQRNRGKGTRRACGNAIRMRLLETEVTAEFEAADDAEVAETVISGSDFAEEIAQAQLAIKDLDVMADDYDEKHAALVRELRRLRDLPSLPARVLSVFTGRTEGDAFKAMSHSERQAFIRQWTLTVFPEGTDPRWKLSR